MDDLSNIFNEIAILIKYFIEGFLLLKATKLQSYYNKDINLLIGPIMLISTGQTINKYCCVEHEQYFHS